MIEARIDGNTPADAGNSSCCFPPSPRSRKHPRRCGELGRLRHKLTDHLETPPQMRGTRRPEAEDPRRRGNTPADAGNSSPSLRSHFERRKHPRRCGELCGLMRSCLPKTETPPQMRGTLSVCAFFAVVRGNTPADAGNSVVLLVDKGVARKHPRRCGELGMPFSSVWCVSETPPQMRGTQQYIEFQPNQITIS